MPTLSTNDGNITEGALQADEPARPLIDNAGRLGQRVQAAVSAPSQVAAQVEFGVLAGGADEPGQVGGRRQPYGIGRRSIGFGEEPKWFVIAHHDLTVRSILSYARSSISPGASSIVAGARGPC